MEWLLILALHLPPEEANIEDMRFSTYEACMQAVENVLKGELIPVRRGPGIKLEDRAKPSIKANLIYPVIRSEVSCIQAPKEENKLR